MTRTAWSSSREAIALLEAQPPGPELVAAYGELAGLHVVFLSDYPGAIAAAERSLALAAELRLPEPARALGFRGSARATLGDREGLDDLRRALALSIERGKSRDAGIFHTNLSEALSYYDGPEAAITVAREGIEFAGRRGISAVTLWVYADLLNYLAAAGRPDRGAGRVGAARGPAGSIRVDRLDERAFRAAARSSRSAANRNVRRAMPNGSPWRRATPPKPSRSPAASPPRHECF